jgi:hypothetical protein
MIELFGPSYRYAGEVLTKPEIIYVQDHHYDEENQCFHIKRLMENSTCDPNEHLLIFDHINHDDELTDYNHICLPIFQAAEVNQFINQKIILDWTQKTRTFNFMINKPRPHREFLLMLIEHFKLENYSYSLPWKKINFSQSGLKSRMNNDLYHKIVDGAVGNISGTNYAFGPEVTMDQGIRNGNFKNSETYNYLLKTNVFEPSCISLITEPLCFEKETLHTEKTIMSMYGGTLPIWVGGWKLAEYARSLGFDVFDDIIDHSYESLNDPWDRCYYAIEKNIELLTNFDLAKQYIDKNQSRLRKNVLLLETNPFFSDVISKIEQYPEPIKSNLFAISSKYRYSMFKDTDSIRLLGDGIRKRGIEYDRTKVKFSG